MSDTSDEEGRRLFDEQARGDTSEQDSNDSSRHKRKSKSKKHSSGKKDKKSKKSKKGKYQYEEEEDDMQEEEEEFSKRRKIKNDIANLIQSEAEQDDLTEQASDYEREIDAEQEKKYYEQFYGVKKKRATEKYLQKFENKNQQQINKFYQKKAREVEQNEQTTMRTPSDPSVFMVGCSKGFQEEMVMCILNKAKYCASHPGKYICKIISAFASKKKHPGKIFVEAQNDKDVKNSLEGFTNINVNSVKEVEYQTYCSIFEVEVVRRSLYQPGEFVRIRKGLYADDLARVHRVYKHKIDVILVPRINLRLIQEKIKDIEKNVPQNIQILKKNEVFKKYTSTKMQFNDPKNRPPKQNLSIQSFQEFASLPHNKKVTLTQQGLIILSFYLFEISKPQGTILPIELEPFSKTGNILEEFQNSAENGVKISVKSNFIIGETVIVTVGQNKGMYGKVVQSDPEKVLLRCQNAETKGIKLIEMPEHLERKFAEGQKIIVINGNSKGVEGTIIRQEGGLVVVWTENNNEIKVSKLDVESKKVSTAQFQNPLGLRRDDIIKTSKGIIGLVLSTNKYSIKIIDSTNTISLINNIDFSQKVASYNTETRNKNGQVIRREANVKIANGLRKGVTCMVKRVYQHFAFLFNPDFRNTHGYCVEQVENCILITQRLDGKERKDRVKQKAEADDEFKVGLPIMLKAGPLKGYRAIVKSITKDQIEISIPQKNLTEWMPRSSLSQLDRAPSVAETTHGHKRSPGSQRSHSGSPPRRKSLIQQNPQMTGVYRPSTNNSPTYA